MKAKKFLFHSLLLVTAFFAMYILLFFFQLGAPLEAEWWVSNTYKYKDFRAKKIPSRKIIVIGGSNVLFGITSQLIEEETGLPVVNLATHGGLEIDFIYYKIKQHIKEGDIVVLPLEFEFYSRSGDISEWFSRNMQAWGQDYLNQLPLFDLVKFIITAEPGRVFDGVKEQFASKRINTKTIPEKKVLEQLNALWTKEDSKWKGYSYKSLNRAGDINVEKPGNYTGEFYYLEHDIDVTPHFIDNYKKIEKLVKEYHGSLYLTYPVTARNKHFDLSNENSVERIVTLESKLKEQKITIQCNAALFNLDRDFFFDNHYHPDKYGAKIRSYNLSYCLKRLTAENYQKLSYGKALNQTNLIEQKVALEKMNRVEQ